MFDSLETNISHRGPTKTLESNEAETPWNRFTSTLLVTRPKPLQQHKKSYTHEAREDVFSVFLFAVKTLKVRKNFEIPTDWGSFGPHWHNNNNVDNAYTLTIKFIQIQTWHTFCFLDCLWVNISHPHYRYGLEICYWNYTQSYQGNNCVKVKNPTILIPRKKRKKKKEQKT